MELYDPQDWYDLHLRLIHFGDISVKAKIQNVINVHFKIYVNIIQKSP